MFCFRRPQEARDAALAAKKSEHLRDEAAAALEEARTELKACQLVVDEASEAARLRDQVGMHEQAHTLVAWGDVGYRSQRVRVGRGCICFVPHTYIHTHTPKLKYHLMCVFIPFFCVGGRLIPPVLKKINTRFVEFDANE